MGVDGEFVGIFVGDTEGKVGAYVVGAIVINVGEFVGSGVGSFVIEQVIDISYLPTFPDTWEIPVSSKLVTWIIYVVLIGKGADIIL